MIDRQKAISIALGVALAALALALYHWRVLETLELKTLDLRFRMRGPVPIHSPIVLVNIDQDSFDELQLPWPWPRDLHGELTRKLTKGGAKLIAFDILFTEPKPDPQEDREFADAIKAAGNVIVGAELSVVESDFGPKTVMNLPIPVLRDVAMGYGLVNQELGPDAVVRSTRPALFFQDRAFPSFGQRVFQAIANHPGDTKVAPDSYWINFRGPNRSFPTVPYYRVLREEIDINFFRDKIVLIGPFAASLKDIFPTPFSAVQQMSGVEIQANFIDTLVAGNPIVPYEGGWHLGLFLILATAAIWLSLRLNPIKAFALVMLLLIMFSLGCVFAFANYRIWFPLTPALLGMFLSYGGITLISFVREQRERLRYRAQFMKYVSPDIVADILENREGLALGGRRRHITVLFSDVRGFTGISEKIGPEQVVSFLSRYFAEITKIVFNNGGTVDKFMGDGMMAIFGAPKAHGDDALRAVRTGIEMIELVKAHSAEWTAMLGKEMAIGIGINSGEAVVGSIGSELRSDYTAIGDTVNLASRLETLTKELGVPIVISETTAAEIDGAIALLPLQRVKVVGRESALLVYTSAAHVESDIAAAVSSMEPYVQQHK